MQEHQNLTGIILAAGNGSRYFSRTPKQFTVFADEPMLLTTIKTFMKSPNFDRVIVVVSKNHEDYLKELPEEIQRDNRILFVSGGATRGDSIQQGLLRHQEICSGLPKAQLVLHDSCRPFVSKDHLEKVASNDEEGDAWVTYSRTGDAFAVESKGKIAPLEVEGNLLAMHTPIKLSSSAIEQVLAAKPEDLNRGLATFLLKSGLSVKLIQTDGSTRKITFPEDGYGYSEN